MTHHVPTTELVELVDEYAGPRPYFVDVNHERRRHAAILAVLDVALTGIANEDLDEGAALLVRNDDIPPAVDDDTTDPALDHRARHRDVAEARAWVDARVAELAREDP